MKIKKGFITHTVGEKHMMVGGRNTGFAGLVKSNRTAGEIVDLLKEETDRDTVIGSMVKKYPDAPKEFIENDVDMVIGKLREIGALEE